jgi:molybdate transport system regulatory protein
MKPHLGVSIECDGLVVLNEWRVQLLEAIDQTGSINGAAEIMKVVYPSAWKKIRDMEKTLGFQLVETQVGGTGGGGAKITPKGHELMKEFRALSQDVTKAIGQHFDAFFE